MTQPYNLKVKDWGGSSVDITYTYMPGSQGSRVGPREDWTPDEDADINILSAKYADGTSVLRDDELDDLWYQAIHQDQMDRDTALLELHEESIHDYQAQVYA